MSDLTKFRDHCRRMAADRRAVIPWTAAQRALWTALADEIDEYLAAPTDAVDLFGEVTAEPMCEEVGMDERKAVGHE